MNQSLSTKNILSFSLGIGIVSTALYLISNVKITNVPSYSNNEPYKTVLWCGPNSGVLGYRGSLDIKHNPLIPFNERTLDNNKDLFINELNNELDKDNTPLWARNISKMFFNNLYTTLTDSFKESINQECKGNKDSIYNFFYNLDELGSVNYLLEDNIEEKNDYSNNLIENNSISTPSFFCVLKSEGEVVQDKLVFQVTNNCESTIDLISWDVNFYEPGVDKILDTSILQISDLSPGSTKQDYVYLDSDLIPEHFEYNFIENILLSTSY